MAKSKPKTINLEEDLTAFILNEATRDGLSFSQWVNRCLRQRVNRLISSRRHVVNLATDEVLAAQPVTHSRKKKP